MNEGRAPVQIVSTLSSWQSVYPENPQNSTTPPTITVAITLTMADSGSSLVLLLLLMSFLFLQSTAQTQTTLGSVLFIDSPTHQYLRSPSPQNLQSNSMSVMEVGAIVSVLLGLAAPPLLATASSSKLNELLMPNPFDRPRHVFMLEVPLAEDSQAAVDLNSALFQRALQSKVISSPGSVEIELPGQEEVAFFSLNGPDSDSYMSITDKEINDFAQSLGGSYISDNLEALNGELIIPLPSGLKMNLHMSKKADREFATGLIYMIENVRKAVETKQDLSGRNSDVAELVGGYFDSIKNLQEEYGSEDIAQQATDLLLTTVSKVLGSLQAKHKGKIAAVILFSKLHSSQPQKMLDVTFDSRPAPRWLEEVKPSTNSTIVAEVALVRVTLAWITGIVLLIATLIGVYLLVNMPLTRDTLLYSNVKLD